MATIKSFTDISQSKKLAKILPIESADMFLAINGTILMVSKYFDEGYVTADNTAVPCWSLAALISILPSGYVIVKNYHGFYYVESRDHAKATNIFNNPIDACVVMIEKLKELNLL